MGRHQTHAMFAALWAGSSYNEQQLREQAFRRDRIGQSAGAGELTKNRPVAIDAGNRDRGLIGYPTNH